MARLLLPSRCHHPPLPPRHPARPPAGRTVAPLADLQAWQVERLTLCAVGDLDLYRAAFTHKSALPTELRVEKVGVPVV